MTREEKYIHFFTHLTKENLVSISEQFAEDAHFKDPFNDVVGINSIKKVFTHMFETTDDPKFIVNHHAIDKDNLLLQWSFYFYKNKKQWSVEGSSLVSFNTEDQVQEHIDYWDPAEQIYSKISLLKPMMNFLRSKLTAN